MTNEENRNSGAGPGFGIHHDNQPVGKLIVGLLAIGVGALFLLNQQGIIHIKVWELWRFWPLILIAVGIGKLFERGNRNKVVEVGVMFLIGTVFLLINFGYVNWGEIWPVCLIGGGLLMLWQAFRPSGGGQFPTGSLGSNVVFSSIEKVVNENNFTGGPVHTVFGTILLDLRNADIQDGKAVLDVNVVFGSVEMKVPDTWKVDVETGAVFGACENKTRIPQPSAAPKTLVVRGDIVFGSVEIRN